MRFAAYFALVASMLLWSGNWIVGRAVREDISPAVASLGRLLIVVLVVLPFAWPGLADKLRRMGRADWRLMWVLALMGGGIHLGMQWQGLRYTTATNGVLFLSTCPVFILLLARFLLKERVGPLQWIGVAVSFVGIGVIVSRGDLEVLASLRLNPGDFLALGAMLMWAYYTIRLKDRRDGLDMMQFMLVLAILGGITLIPWVGWELANDARASLSLPGILGFVYSGIGALLLAYLGWGYAVARIGAARAGPWMHLIPGFGILLAAWILGEYPSWYHFAGIGLILAGIGLASIKTAAPVRASSAASTR